MGQIDRILALTPLRFAATTVEHPFDTDFQPAQRESEWIQICANGESEYALLLCRHSERSWLAWSPSQGETILLEHQLRGCLPE